MMFPFSSQAPESARYYCTCLDLLPPRPALHHPGEVFLELHLTWTWPPCAGRAICAGHHGHLWGQYLSFDHRHHGDHLHHVGLWGEHLLRRYRVDVGLQSKHLLQGNRGKYWTSRMICLLLPQACWFFFSPAILFIIFIADAVNWQKPSYGEVEYPGFC